MTVTSQFSKQNISRSFSGASTGYDDFALLQRMIGDRLAEKYMTINSASETILDAGSGTGYLTAKLKQAYPNSPILALDIATGMLAKAKESQGRKAAYICADAESQPLQDESISGIFSNLAFQWSTRLEVLFSECYRTLKQDGLIAFSSFGPQTLAELNDAWRAADGAVHVNDFATADEILKALSQAGFSDTCVEYETITFHYPSPIELMKDLKGMGAHNINQQRKKGLTGKTAFKRMLDHYELCRQPAGIPATFQAVYGFARKTA